MYEKRENREVHSKYCESRIQFTGVWDIDIGGVRGTHLIWVLPF